MGTTEFPMSFFQREKHPRSMSVAFDENTRPKTGVFANFSDSSGGEIHPMATVYEESRPKNNFQSWVTPRKTRSHESLLHKQQSMPERAWSPVRQDDDNCECDENEDIAQPTKQGLFRDLCQTQLSLWTFSVSTLLTYFWQKRVHARSFLLAFIAIGATMFMSAVLASVVLAAHFFNTDFAAALGGFRYSGDKYRPVVRRQNSASSASARKCVSGSSSPTRDAKMHHTRYWQKCVSLERTYVASSRT